MKPKIAICIEGGFITAIRSNISSDIEIEIVDDQDVDSDDVTDRWVELQTELEFGNY